MIKQIIFDLDGTLVDSLDIFIKIGNEMAHRYGYQPITQEKIKELLKLPMRKRIESLKIPVFKIPRIGVEILNAFNSYAAEIKPIEGIAEMLHTLHGKGYGLNIVSSNSVHNIETFLKVNHLELFDNIQSSKGLFGKHVTIGRLITKLGAAKEDVIYIGDEQRDVEASRKIGIRVISVLWGFDSKELLEKVEPHFYAEKPGDIVEIIEAIE